MTKKDFINKISTKKNLIKKILKWIFGGFSLILVGWLVFIIVYDALTGATSDTTPEYCAKYGLLASPGCWK